MKNIAVLFARTDSVYKTLPNCDVWDIERDARQWPGGAPVVAHPPCRAWGRLRQFAKPRPDEKELALYAIKQVRKYGGVLEHPKASTLWKAAGLPLPGEGYDPHGGWTLEVLQFWWGHKAEKATWLYICGVRQHQIPPIPFVMGGAPCVVGYSKRRKGNIPHRSRRPEISKADRERTPIAFAEWLCALATKARGAIA